MESVLVVGAGFMGSGIAQVCAQSGYSVFLADERQEALNRSLIEIKWSLEKFSSKGLLREASQSVLDRLMPVRNLQEAAAVSWVIEAVFEEEKLKKKIFTEYFRIFIRLPFAYQCSELQEG